MPRAATNVLMPGAPDAAVEDAEAAAGSAPAPAAPAEDEADLDAAARRGRAKHHDSAEVAALKAQLAEANAKLAAAATLPQPVYEPKTPHGEQAKAASQFLHLTTTELRARIKSGELRHDQPHYLCKDGYLSLGQPRTEA